MKIQTIKTPDTKFIQCDDYKYTLSDNDLIITRRNYYPAVTSVCVSIVELLQVIEMLVGVADLKEAVDEVNYAIHGTTQPEGLRLPEDNPQANKEKGE